ncbi:MAG: DNA primase [Parcubacteria group bacterium RIFCSPHIGHO2_01_FULL_47_10b]|nr:MAG: DNA primase [Parcubacteria group bacterium RIFCSPHIGHO2_01_FULL_47_10b]
MRINFSAMHNHVDDIKQRLDIVELINEYVRLEKAGINFKARCPFHNEKTPSFFVSPERGTFKCFGCGAGGDHFSFIEQIEGVNFKEALEILARKAGVTIRYTKADAQASDIKSRLRLLHTEATRFYELALRKSKGGHLAHAYLGKRGLTDQTIAAWHIGYAPSAWRALTSHLHGKGFSAEELVKSGLCIRSDKRPPAGELPVYDRFRARIMFPITAIAGSVVGFSGRILPEAEDAEHPSGKYINSPQTPLYDKSRILYGLDKARLAIRREKRALLVEGQMDVVMSHQAGVDWVVAASGTALTPHHIALVQRYTDTVVMSFDHDEAGAAATKKSIFLALDAGLSVEIVAITGGKDPADMAKHDPAEWKKAAAQSMPVMDYFFSYAFAKHDPTTISGKKAISAYLFEPLYAIPNTIERHAWLQKLAQKLGSREEDVVAEFEKYASKQRSPVAPTRESKQLIAHGEIGQLGNPCLTSEESLLSLLIKHPSLAVAHKKELGTVHLQNNWLQDILTLVIQKATAATKAGDYLHTLDPQFHIRFNELALRGDVYFNDSSTAAMELDRLCESIRSCNRRSQLHQLEQQLRTAEANGNDTERHRIEQDIAALFH